MKTIAQISLETRSLIDRLSKAAIGDVITYDELSKLIGRNVQEEARGFLNSARRILLNQEGIWFDVIHGVGVKRCNDAEKVAAASSTLKAIRRKARKGDRIAESIEDYAAMTSADKFTHQTTRILFNLMLSASNKKRVAGLADKIDTSAQLRLNMKKTLEMFK